MNHLVISLIVLYAVASCDASIFSLGSSSAETKEIKSPGYLPVLKVHRYSGVHINPLQGPPVYLPLGPNELNNIEGQTTQLTPDQLQQFDVINQLATFLPPDYNLQEMDLSAVLPYVDLISEDSLEKFKLTVEANKPKEKSKILKILAFLKQIKEKKLKPFKYVAGLGSSLVSKKKSWLFGSGPTTTPEPFTETVSVSYPGYNFAYNPNFIPQKQYFNSIPAPAALPSPPAQLPLNYFQQYPTYSIKNEQRIPLENSLPPKQTITEIHHELPRAPFNTPALPALPQFPQFPSNFQFPSFFPSGQFQPNPAPGQNSPPQTQSHYQYPSLPAQSAEPAKTEITYEYKQTPAHTFAANDNQAIRQFASFNQAALPSISATKIEPSKEQQFSFEYKQTPAHTFAAHPSKEQQFSYHGQAIPTFYQNSIPEPNKFFTASSNDLIAAGSEDVEKINEQSKPESSSKSEAESSKINNSVTSTEISVSKSQPSSPKRVILRPVTAPTHPSAVYPRDENSKEDSNNSSPVNPSTSK